MTTTDPIQSNLFPEMKPNEIEDESIQGQSATPTATDCEAPKDKMR
jgi:hypothetical protein